jgi:homoaconitase/3-isopropylmalate dehydratase large subunit
VATISQKIFTRASGSSRMAEPGEIVEASVDYAMSHDGTSVLAIKSFREMGSKSVWDPRGSSYPSTTLCPRITRRGHAAKRGSSLDQGAGDNQLLRLRLWSMPSGLP